VCSRSAYLRWRWPVRVLCVQNVWFESPGGIADWASARGHSFEVARPFDAAAPHPGAFDLLVVMGGPMNVYQEREHPFLAEAKQLISLAIKDGNCVLGVCLGAQLVADVLGGPVTRGVQPEIGWYPVTLTGEGEASAVLGRLPKEFAALHWHGDTFAIPPGATRLASSAACENQAFEYDGGWVVGLQFHLETTRESLNMLVDNAGTDLVEGEWITSAKEILAPEAPFAASRERLFTLLDGMASVRVSA
ncbi:MAG: type 1 glutamine amidotransferase, partial [Coriobacteriia bacterium]|nr:type 1 glutamine amidotransferase [Coriobacteriia bacterium]